MDEPLQRSKPHHSLFFLCAAWLVIAFFYAHQYFLRVTMSAFAAYFSNNLGVSAEKIGLLSAAFFLAYVLMKIPAGILIDVFGLRISLAIASLVCALGAFLFSIPVDTSILFFARFLMGLGGTFALMGAISFARHWFDEKFFSLLTSFTLAFGTLGAILGGAPLVSWVAVSSVHHVMVISGCISLLIALAVCFLLKSIDVKQLEKKQSVFHEIITLFQHRPIWTASFMMGFMYAPVICYFSFWFSFNAHAIYHDTFRMDANVASIAFLGLFFGNPLCTWISNYFKNKLRVLQATIILAFLFLSVIIFAPPRNIYEMYILSFCFGLSMGGSALIYTYTLMHLPKAVSGTASAVINLFQVGIGALFLPVIGFILTKHHEFIRHDITTILHYRVSDYHYALSILPIGMLLALVLSVLFGRIYQK